MRQNQSSRSAEGVAFLRAIEAQKPEAERICFDPYARALISGGISYTLSKLVVDVGVYERIAPGATAFIAAREQYIDDFLKACLTEGVAQVVILGAGFDTRAYRIAGIEKTKVFEIDAPATQEVKQTRLRKIFNPLPDHVTFLPVDFNTQMLGERLSASSYNELAKTLFIWQGVTYFLTVEGVDSTLAFIADHSGPGSSVIFDYFYNETLHDSSRSDVKMMRRAARLTGEEYMFGIDQGQIEPFLSRRGFHDIRNVTLEDLKQLYFAGLNARRSMPTGIAIASASVNKDGN
jgi:methyltransferase (TIGR00027 family)